MAEVVRGSTQYLSDDDALAIGVYLKTLPATAAATQRQATSASPALMDIGGKIYRQQCVQCHQAAGRARVRLARAGRQSDRAVARQCHPHGARRRLRAGHGGQSPPHGMPPFGQLLNDNDIAALVTYIRNSWGNEAGGGVAPLERATRPRAIDVGAPGVLGRPPVSRLRGRASGRGLQAWAGPAPRRPVRPACARPRPGLRSGMAAVQAQRAGELAAGREDRTGRDADAARQRLAMQRQCVDALGQLQPQEEAALWPRVMPCRQTRAPPPSPSGPAGLAACHAAGAGDGRSRPVPGIPRSRARAGRRQRGRQLEPLHARCAYRPAEAQPIGSPAPGILENEEQCSTRPCVS